jgi:hypothetical protein
MPTGRTPLLVLLVVATFVGTAQAQVEPDPSLWTPASVRNPSGARPVPVVQYDPVTGIMSVHTLGVDGTSDTTGPTAIGGDDVGMISLIVAGPAATDVLLDGFVGGVSWSGHHFNGKQQLFGFATAAQFLTPGTTDVFQYPAWLTPADFGEVEMGINFVASEPGAVLVGAVQLPEPGCPADLDASGEVGLPDLLIVLAAWGPCPGCLADLDGDDEVGLKDLLLVLSGWGVCA